jgi:DNA modification methylase
MASGEMSDEEFCAFMADFLKGASAHCRDGALLYVFIDWRHVHQLIAAGIGVGLSYFHLCVWAKTNAGMGSYYRSRHELVVVFKKGNGPHINNIDLGRYGRNRSNVWDYEGANSINPSRRAELRLHPTVKPVKLCVDAIKDCTAANDIVFDPFLGSGSTLIGAEDCGRRCYATELSPHYVDVAIRRWHEFTGDAARLETSGQTFEEVRCERAGETPPDDDDVR